MCTDVLYAPAGQISSFSPSLVRHPEKLLRVDRSFHVTTITDLITKRKAGKGRPCHLQLRLMLPPCSRLIMPQESRVKMLRYPSHLCLVPPWVPGTLQSVPTNIRISERGFVSLHLHRLRNSGPVKLQPTAHSQESMQIWDERGVVVRCMMANLGDNF